MNNFGVTHQHYLSSESNCGKYDSLEDLSVSASARTNSILSQIKYQISYSIHVSAVYDAARTRSIPIHDLRPDINIHNIGCRTKLRLKLDFAHMNEFVHIFFPIHFQRRAVCALYDRLMCRSQTESAHTRKSKKQREKKNKNKKQ